MRLLREPAWKFTSLIEGWAWEHVKEGEEATLERALSRPVDFTWIRSESLGVQGNVRDPSSWQTNQPGELLLSGKRKRREEG